MNRLTRRQFLKLTAATAAGAALVGPGCAARSAEDADRPRPSGPTGDQAYLAVARGGDPAEITKAAVAALGGIGRFVRSNDDVIVKPNICVAYHPPEYAATTNPTVVATLVTLCLEAGAKRVRVMDTPFGGTAESAYAVTGIEEAVKAAGGEMEIMSPVKFTEFPIPDGQDIAAWEVYRDIVEADVVINVPIAKHHSIGRLTLGMKNVMGVMGDNRGKIHRQLGQSLADINLVVAPKLTVIDATRILLRHGPTGGDLDDVKVMDTLIASPDMVAADAYATTLFGKKPEDVPATVAGHEMGIGEINLEKVRIVKV